jgi:hypothetical protein
MTDQRLNRRIWITDVRPMHHRHAAWSVIKQLTKHITVANAANRHRVVVI